MSEMRRYGNPPQLIKRIMQAVLLLLGVDEYTSEVCYTKYNIYSIKYYKSAVGELKIAILKPVIGPKGVNTYV